MCFQFEFSCITVASGNYTVRVSALPWGIPSRVEVPALLTVSLKKWDTEDGWYYRLREEVSE